MQIALDNPSRMALVVGVQRVGRIPISGKKLSRERVKRALTQDELADVIGQSGANVRRIEGEDSTSVYFSTFRAIAKWLDSSVDETKEKLRPDSDLPAGIEPAPNSTDVIPEWDLEVAANAWAPVPICALNYDDEDQRKIVNNGRFRLRIKGRCMEPHYPSGATVTFQLMRIDAEPLQVGADYVVCNPHNEATFKVLIAKDEESITLAALNQGEYPGEMKVWRDDVARVARVVAVEVPARKPSVPKVRKGK